MKSIMHSRLSQLLFTAVILSLPTVYAANNAINDSRGNWQDSVSQTFDESAVASTLFNADKSVLDPERIALLIEYFQSEGMDVEELFEDDRFEIYEGIGDRFRRSAERKSLNLDEYKKVLGFEDKRDRIVPFIEKHLETFEEAEAQYNISKFVIAAILGIESDFGQNIGRFNPFNTYVSMYAEDYRSDFARAQLEELILFTRRNNIDPFELKSSYAGAMSYAQFIPYSLNQWFVGDDIFDMDNNIHSIANYLAHFKEITGTMDGAVMRYNPSRLYTDAVLSLAKEAEELWNSRQ